MIRFVLLSLLVLFIPSNLRADSPSEWMWYGDSSWVYSYTESSWWYMPQSNSESPSSSSGWMWHGAFPWLYSHHDRLWRYVRSPSADGKFYVWKSSDSEWYFFDELLKRWTSVEPSRNATDSNKWAEWEAKPEAYGGLEVLAKIRKAKETNLKHLGLEKKPISDVTPLGGLKNLTSLSLRSCNISDLTPLAGLYDLVNLDLYYNNISDVSPLAELTNLKTLDLRGSLASDKNRIADITPLRGLVNLETLQLGGLPYGGDLTPLGGLFKLKVLDFSDNEITDLTPLAGLRDLRCLRLEGNPTAKSQKLMLWRAFPSLKVDGRNQYQ